MELLAVAKRAIPFLLGLVVGLVPAWIFAPVSEVSPVVFENSSKTWQASCKTGKRKSKAYRSSVETPLAIQSKPQAKYTESARRENVEGAVKLRVEFLADGTIGEIEPIAELPNGLTEQALKAAEQIRFRPAAVDGMPVNSTKLIEYTFSIY
jgi:TonB family protein